MKSKFLYKFIAAVIVTSSISAAVPKEAQAAWISNYYGGWAYSNGYSLSVGWNNINGIWYYFNSYGVMQTGWINSGGQWYYLDQSGAMQTGVIQVEGKIYLLGPSGAMQTGSAVIGGKMYYFGADGVCIGTDVPMPLKAYDYYGNYVQPYVPKQISGPNVNMDTTIPLDTGEQALTEYRVYYKDDDGEDLITKKVECDTNKSYAYITLYEPTKAGYEFIEWNTKKNGEGTSYDSGDKIKLTHDIKLYAQWNEIEEKNKEEDKISVTGITIKAVGSDATRPTTTLGTKLQLTKRVAPSNATNTKVTWKVVNGAENSRGKAEISSTGLLTPVNSGTVLVKAISADDSSVYGEIYIIIQ